MIHNMTPTLTIALQTLAGQQLAALTMPGAYGPSLSGGRGSKGTTVTQLRALYRRGLASRVALGSCLESYAITDAGLHLVASYVRQQCADVQTKAQPGLGSCYPGIVAWAEQEIAGADQLLARLS